MSLAEPLPETGSGLKATLERLIDLQMKAGANIAGPRCFHFVTRPEDLDEFLAVLRELAATLD